MSRKIVNISNAIGGYNAYFPKKEHNRQEYIGLTDIRCGLWFPTVAKKGYYSVFGQKKERNPDGRHHLFFITEHENSDYTKMLEQLALDIEKYKIKRIYADQDENKGLFQALRERIKTAMIPNAVPFSDVEYGKVVLREWLEKKNIENIQKESILSQQLKKVTDDNIEPAFYSIVYLISGFLTQKVMSASKQIKVQDPGGWT